MAAPVISTITFSTTGNLSYDDGTVTMTVVVTNMVDDDDMVLFEVIGQSKYIKLVTSDYTNYTVVMDMEEFTLGDWLSSRIVAINGDGQDEDTNLFLTVLDNLVGEILKETMDNGISGWDTVEASTTTGTPGSGLGVSVDNRLTFSGVKLELDSELDLTDRVSIQFFYTPDTATSISEELHVGLFNYSITDLDVLGIRFIADGAGVVTPTVAMHGSTDVDVAMTTVLSKQAAHPTKIQWYLFKLDWVPATQTIYVELWGYSGGVWTLLERSDTYVSAVPTATFDSFGVRNVSSSGTPPYDTSDGFVNNMYVRTGEVLSTYPKIVGELEVDDAFSPTDVQILAHYYDFEEGTDIVADGNLTVEVFDRDDVLITTLSGLLRDDGWYEAYWDTTTTTKSTYNIKVTAEINSKTYVMEELVSVQ